MDFTFESSAWRPKARAATLRLVFMPSGRDEPSVRAANQAACRQLSPVGVVGNPAVSPELSYACECASSKFLSNSVFFRNISVLARYHVGFSDSTVHRGVLEALLDRKIRDARRTERRLFGGTLTRSARGSPSSHCRGTRSLYCAFKFGTDAAAQTTRRNSRWTACGRAHRPATGTGVIPQPRS